MIEDLRPFSRLVLRYGRRSGCISWRRFGSTSEPRSGLQICAQTVGQDLGPVLDTDFSEDLNPALSPDLGLALDTDLGTDTI